jgi:hypothetical protein
MWIPDQNTEVVYFAQKHLLRDVFATAESKGQGFIEFYDGCGLGDHLVIAQDREEAIASFRRHMNFSQVCSWNHVGLSFFARTEQTGWEHLQPIEMKQRLGL